MSTSSDEDNCISPQEEVVSTADYSLLPAKSRERYIKTFELFENWRLSKGAETYSESLLLSYFMELSETKQPSTLWGTYSMLKAVMKSKFELNIKRYSKLIPFLKRKSVGFKSKKSKTFTAVEIDKFLNEAPDYDFLGMKVVLIIGINGGCHISDMVNLTVSDIERHSDKLMLVKLHTKGERSFVIREEYVTIIDKYMALRPAHTKTKRFFVQYIKGRCTIQVMGKNKINEMPRKIANFLKVRDPHRYTGYCLRRTSLRLLTDSGADLSTIKRCKESTLSTSPLPVECKYAHSEDTDESKPKVCKTEPSTYIETHEDWSLPCIPGEHTSAPRSPSPAASPHPRPRPPLAPPDPPHETVVVDNVSNATVIFPKRNITFHLNNCSNFTFNF